MLSFQFWIWQQNVSPGSLWCTFFVLCCVDDGSASGRLLWVRWRIEASYVYVYMSVHVCTCMYMRVRFAYFQSCNMIWFPLLVREINTCIGFSRTMYTETGKHTPGCKIRSCLKISLHNLITYGRFQHSLHAGCCWCVFAVDCPPCLDIAIAVDSSGTIGNFRWRNRVLPFLRQFVRSNVWNIGTTNDAYQVSNNCRHHSYGGARQAKYVSLNK